MDIAKRANKLFQFLETHTNLILILIIFLAFIIRLYFFIQVGEQPIWWDEGDYLALAKKWGSGIIPEMQTKQIWSPRRPFLMPMIESLFFMLNLNEIGIRLLYLFISLGCVYVTYLLGKKIYNKNIGLISAFLMAVFYLQLFYTYRLLLEIPSLFLTTLTMLFFWKGYVKKDKKSILLTGAFLGLSIFTRAANLLITVPMFFVALFENKLQFLKKKEFWFSILIVILILSPFIIYLVTNYPNPLKKFTGIGEGRFSKLTLDVLLHGNTKEFIKHFTVFLKFPLLYIFLIGLILCSDYLLGLDFIFKKQGEDLRKHIFLVIWILVILLFFGITTSQSYLEDRYLMNIFPAVFIIISVTLERGYSLFLKFNEKYKIPAVTLVIILLLIAGYYNLSYASQIINAKKLSFSEVKQSALWMKENSKPADAIISNSIPQVIYYAERPTYMMSGEKELYKLKESNPKYWVASIYEPSGQWFYEYPEKHKFKPVQAYSLDGKNPSLVVYQIRD